MNNAKPRFRQRIFQHVDTLAAAGSQWVEPAIVASFNQPVEILGWKLMIQSPPGAVAGDKLTHTWATLAFQPFHFGAGEFYEHVLDAKDVSAAGGTAGSVGTLWDNQNPLILPVDMRWVMPYGDALYVNLWHETTIVAGDTVWLYLILYYRDI